MIYFNAMKQKVLLITHYGLVKYIHLSGNVKAHIPGGLLPHNFYLLSSSLEKINAVVLNLFEKLLKKKPGIIRSDGAGCKHFQRKIESPSEIIKVIITLQEL